MTWTLAELDQDTCLVTVNRRLATELRDRHDHHQAQAGRAVWPSADILPWGAWLGRCYTALLDAGQVTGDLLNPTQERLLWHDLVQRDAPPEGLLQPAGAAQCAQQAYALYRDWQLEHQPLDTLGGDETRRFLAWIPAFETELARRGLLSMAQLPGLIAAAAARGELPLPGRLAYSGFDALAPAQSALFEALRAAGCEVREHRPVGEAGTCRRIEARDGENELRLAAAWAAGILADRPAARIGIVSPQITRRRHDLQRVFTQVLAPGTYLPDGGRQAVFDLSLGEPLADCALVAHALTGLELLAGDLPLATLGQWLRSPFVGGQTAEWEGRALLDAALREDGLPDIPLHRLRFRIGQYPAGDPRHCPDLANRLDAIAQLRAALPARAGPAAWVRQFDALLQATGWPGDQPLDSREYQQRERLQRLFSEFAELGKVRSALRLGEALALFRSLATDTLFQPESPATPVRILGPLEAAGLAFDAIWLLDMDDTAWPPAPTPNPLLPSRLQRELGMPHASAERELLFARTLTDRLRHGAAQLVASHARADDDRQRRPSPLIRDWPPAHGADGEADPVFHLFAGFANPGALEPLPDTGAGPAGARQRGGASLLAAQANCPFQAVAAHRLAAAPLPEATLAVDGATTGNLVHELLQRVWQHLGGSAALNAMDAGAERGLIEPLARATLEDLGRRRPDLFTHRFRQIEAARLTRLLGEWLAVERARGQAFEVVALERDGAVELQGLVLKTRADRVDRLADGSLAVIDYKTGRAVSHDGWFDERLSEPQLPLYCLSGGDDVAAAMLARVRRDQTGCRFVGLGREPGFAPGVAALSEIPDAGDWAGLLARWQRSLDALAGEFVRGRADPTPSPHACEYCDFGALCRARALPMEDA